MLCNQPGVKEYLHQNGRLALTVDPSSLDAIYRLSPSPNPLDVGFFNSSYLTAFSTKWAKHYETLEDVCAVGPAIKDYVLSGTMRDISSILIEVEQDDLTSDFAGFHIIKTVIAHTPEPCDYPHLEVLIRHQFTLNGVDYDETISHYLWPGSLLEKRRKNSFIKQLRKCYQSELSNRFLTVVSDEESHQRNRIA
jgi:hypothetical protein